MSTNAIFKGDNTGAFGNNFITITVHNPYLYPISKIEFITNSGTCIQPKPFTDPDNFQRETIELTVNYDSTETTKLKNGANVGNLVVYDVQGRQSTCQQSLVFYAKNGVISKDGQCKC